MRKLFLILPLLFLACSSQKELPSKIADEQRAELEAVKEANELIASKKYESAFRLLESIDPKNSKPDILLLKEDIALNYFVVSMMHNAFSFKDIGENEDIMDYRGKDGQSSMHLFQADSLLQRLIKIYPDNCKLYKGLGEFYNDAYLKYEDRWLKSEGELIMLIQSNFQKAADGNCADYASYEALGLIELRQAKYKESIPYFLKSIEMNNGHAASNYNLAYAYLYANDRQNALKYAKNALDLYADKKLKSDAARMIGQIYIELKDDEKAIESFELAEEIDQKNYYNLKNLLNLYLKTGNKKADETTKTFFDLDPKNPTIYNNLDEIYHGNKKANELIAFLKSQLPAFKDNDEVQGALNFYLGDAYFEIDKKISREYYLEAKKAFGKVLDKDHQVFSAIDEMLKR